MSIQRSTALALVLLSGWVLRGTAGGLIYECRTLRLVRRTSFGNAHGPVIADLDGDGRLDVFIVVGTPMEGRRFGTAIALTGFQGRGSGWTTLRHDVQNSGNAAWRPAGAAAGAAAGDEPAGRFELFVLGRMQDGEQPHVSCDRECCAAARRAGRAHAAQAG